MPVCLADPCVSTLRDSWRQLLWERLIACRAAALVTWSNRTDRLVGVGCYGSSLSYVAIMVNSRLHTRLSFRRGVVETHDHVPMQVATSQEGRGAAAAGAGDPAAAAGHAGAGSGAGRPARVRESHRGPLTAVSLPVTAWRGPHSVGMCCSSWLVEPQPGRHCTVSGCAWQVPYNASGGV